MSQYVRFFVVVLALVAVLFAITAKVAPTVHAASLGPCGSCYGTGYYTINYAHTTGTYLEGEFSLILAPGTQGAMTEDVNWRNTFNVSLTGGGVIDSSIVSAALGFPVAVGGSSRFTCIVNNTTYQNIRVEFEDVYNIWAYDIYWHGENGWTTYVGFGSALEFMNNRCDRV